MSIRGVFLILVASCGGAPAPMTPVAAAPPSGIVITESALGPITATTPASLVALRQVLAGYDVRPIQRGGLEYQVFKDGEPMFSVIPDEAGQIFNIHVVSPKVTVARRPWKVGAAFTDAAALTACDCWGGQPVCFKKGEHVAIAFDRTCRGLTEPRSRKALEGLTIARTIWNPKPFGDGNDGFGDDQHGGDDDEPPDDAP